MKELLQKLEEKKEAKEDSKAAKEPETLAIYTRRIDTNSLHALHAALPTSKLTTLKLANNSFTPAGLELLVNYVLDSPITRVFIDWNPIPKIEALPDVPFDSPFAKL